jgi:CO dehydrogenase nickel-insertion accessory protein CooC1
MALKFKEAVFKDLQVGSVIVLPNQARSLFLNRESNEIQEIGTIRIFRIVNRTENEYSKTFTTELLELGVEKENVQPLIFEAETKLFEVYEDQPVEQQTETEVTETVEAEVTANDQKVDNRKTIKG